jgi:hypothetical protein
MAKAKKVMTTTDDALKKDKDKLEEDGRRRS